MTRRIDVASGLVIAGAVPLFLSLFLDWWAPRARGRETAPTEPELDDSEAQTGIVSGAAAISAAGAAR